MFNKFINLVSSLLPEHKQDENKDLKLKEKFATILRKRQKVDKIVDDLFQAVQDHLKETGQQ